MGKTMNLIDRVKTGAKTLAVGAKKHARNAVVYGAIGAAALGGVNKAYGEDLTFMNFSNLTWEGGLIYMDNSDPNKIDNLMIREGNGDPNIVSNNGKEVWRIGFIKYDKDNNMIVGGYANNYGWDPNDPNLRGFCVGYYDSTVFPEGSFADDVLIIHDKNGDGIGSFVPDPNNPGYELWDKDLEENEGDNVHYWTEKIEFNGIRGDLSKLEGIKNSDGDMILPQMTIDAREPRTGSANMDDLGALADNWLASDCSYGTGDCDGADWNYDGKVNLQDFAYMAKGWDLDYVSKTGQ